MFEGFQLLVVGFFNGTKLNIFPSSTPVTKHYFTPLKCYDTIGLCKGCHLKSTKLHFQRGAPILLLLLSVPPPPPPPPRSSPPWHYFLCPPHPPGAAPHDGGHDVGAAGGAGQAGHLRRGRQGEGEDAEPLTGLRHAGIQG